MMFVGAIAPIPIWAWCRKYQNSWARRINVVVFFSACVFTPPATGMNIASFLATGLVFQWYIRTRHFTWWSKVSLTVAV